MRGSEVALALGALETPPPLSPLRCLSEVGKEEASFWDSGLCWPRVAVA